MCQIPHLFKIETFGREGSGLISFLENDKSLPFKIERIYWLHGFDTFCKRGGHAHINDEQIIISLNGISEFKVENNTNLYTFTLDEPNTGLYLPKMCWREFSVNKNAVLLCLSALKYNENDYIREYEIFKAQSTKLII